MQEEVENRTVALAFSTTRMTGRVLKAAIAQTMLQQLFPSYWRSMV